MPFGTAWNVSTSASGLIGALDKVSPGPKPPPDAGELCAHAHPNGQGSSKQPWRLREDGILDGATQVPSINYDERPSGEPVTLAVVHAISLPPGEFGGDAIEKFFTNALDYDAHPYFDCLRGLRVSAHFLIKHDGTVVQFVPCEKRAWHAGVSCHAGRTRCNDFSVGIELEGTGEVAYTDFQYEALFALIGVLRRRYPIEDVVGHSDISPGRKTDPGPSFDWMRLRDALQRI